MADAEDAADGVVGLYRRHGAAWAALRGDRPAEGPWLDRFAERLPEGGAVLDVGCGSGRPIARELADCGFAITGVDAAPEMLALFRRNLPGAPALRADMRRLRLGRRFAGLLAWDSLFHLSPADQRPMFRRFADHAAPGAALLFTSGTEHGSAVGALAGEPLYHGSLDPGEYRTLLDAAGFRVVAHAAWDPSCGHRTVWLAELRP